MLTLIENVINPMADFDTIANGEVMDFRKELKEEIDAHNSALEDGWFQMKDPLKEHVEPLDFLIEGFAARGMITLIGGSAGSGKSMLTQVLLSDHNNDLLKCPKPFRSVYLTGADSSETEIRRRSKSIGVNKGLSTVMLPHDRFCVITNEVFFDELKKYLIKKDIDCIVFDTLADFHNGNTYEAQLANITMSRFRILAESTGVSVIIITHTKKGSKIKTKYDVEDISDSRIFATKSDFVFALRSEYKGRSNLIELQCLKSRSEKILPDIRMLIQNENGFGITLSDERFTVEDKQHAQVQKRNEIVQKVKKLASEGHSQRNIADQLGISVGSVNNYVND
jgi:RecA-family ATPase